MRPVSPPPAPLRLLVVDDSSYGVTARRMVLEECGYEVTVCSDTEEAQRCLAASAFDAVVTNHRLPVLDAVGLIAAMRPSQPMLPFILITGEADALGLDSASTGADVVVQKGANEVSHLLRAVRRLVRRKVVRKPPSSTGPVDGRARRNSM